VNRIAAGQIDALFSTRVNSFGDGALDLATPSGPRTLAVDAAYVLIGYDIDVPLLERCGIAVDPVTRVRRTTRDCESNVPASTSRAPCRRGATRGRSSSRTRATTGAKIVRHWQDRWHGTRPSQPATA
jgi:hypothetical protein